MKQVIQNFKTGKLQVEDVPAPALAGQGVIVANRASLISAGTEKTTVSTAQASLIGKAKKRPDLVRQVIQFAKKEGLAATIRKVRDKLDQQKPLGYASAGVVLESNCSEFKPGDRVACAGGGYAVHAETIYVPKNLVAPIPDSVDFEAAAFTTLAAIAMQGVRQADVRLGETVVVTGLGLIGQLTAQLLNANGCRVIGIDIDANAAANVAKAGWCETAGTPAEAAELVTAATGGLGADAVLITAGTSSNQPIESAIELVRKRGTVVVVGAVGMNIPRSPFYEKEVNLTISCSYGPGRYDPSYEEGGIDYPAGYVRWTENRNMQSCLQLMATGKIDPQALVTHRFAIEDAEEAYALILGKTKEPHLGVLLSYSEETKTERRVDLVERSAAESSPGKPSVAFIGAGNFAQTFLLPAVGDSKARKVAICSATGVSAKTSASRFGFERCGTNAAEVLADGEVNTVFIATRHDLHAPLCTEALRLGKHVFVEKPLCLTETELDEIIAIKKPGQLLQVGFNRRFAPLIEKVRAALPEGPKLMQYRVNAGPLPIDHWLLDPDQGGGRIRGELCHFLDTVSAVAGSAIVSVAAAGLAGERGTPQNAAVTCRLADGSAATIIYTAVGGRGLPKERFEVHCGGMSAVLDDFQSLSIHSDRGTRRVKGRGKGHTEEVVAFLDAVQNGGEAPIPFDTLLNITRATFAVETALQTGGVVTLDA